MGAERKPLRFEDRWLWHNGDHPLAEDMPCYADHLPADVHGALAGFIPKPPNVTVLVKAYPTREAAMAALVAAELSVAEGTGP